MTEHEGRDRRRVLRGAATVVAGVAGAGVAAVAVSTPANAAPGDAVVQGAVNNAQATTTTLTANRAAAPTLALQNTASAVVNGLVEAGPSLRLVPNGDLIASAEPGSLSIDSVGDIWVVDAQFAPGEVSRNYLHTTRNSNTTVAIIPQRVVDTRTAEGRRFILNPQDLNGAGQLIGGRSLHVNLGEYVFLGDAVYVNPAAIAPNAGGVLTLYPYATSIPATGNVGFGANSNVSNFAIVGIGFDATVDDAISVFTTGTTHIILDVMAFAVPAPEFVNPAYRNVAAAGARAAAASARTRGDLVAQARAKWSR